MRPDSNKFETSPFPILHHPPTKTLPINCQLLVTINISFLPCRSIVASSQSAVLQKEKFARVFTVDTICQASAFYLAHCKKASGWEVLGCINSVCCDCSFQSLGPGFSKDIREIVLKRDKERDGVFPHLFAAAHRERFVALQKLFFSEGLIR